MPLKTFFWGVLTCIAYDFLKLMWKNICNPQKSEVKPTEKRMKAINIEFYVSMVIIILILVVKEVFTLWSFFEIFLDVVFMLSVFLLWSAFACFKEMYNYIADNANDKDTKNSE